MTQVVFPPLQAVRLRDQLLYFCPAFRIVPVESAPLRQNQFLLVLEARFSGELNESQTVELAGNRDRPPYNKLLLVPDGFQNERDFRTSLVCPSAGLLRLHILQA